MHRILIFNLGGTSTKLAVFDEETLVVEGTIRHTDREIQGCTDNAEQIAFRRGAIEAWLLENHISLDDLSAVVIRSSGAGLCKKGGTYLVTGKLRDGMYAAYRGSFPKAPHPSFIVLPLADEILGSRPVPIYIVDPDGVDEFQDVAYITGHPDLPRSSGFHVLNHKAIARKASRDLGKRYEDADLVVAHMGGGISIAAHRHGLVVDSTSGGSAGEGPFGTNRTGPLPLNKLVDRCFSGAYTKSEIMDLIMTQGGFLAHTGCTDLRIIEQKAADGDAHCDLIIRAFIYQVCRYIGAQFTVLNCQAAAIVLTGGIAYSQRVVGGIRDCVGKLAPVLVYPGEKENEAMVDGVLSVLRGERSPIIL